MRTSLVAVMFVFLLAGVATAQNTPTWEVYGGVQYMRADLGDLQAQANLYTAANGIPAVNIGQHLNAYGFVIGFQQNTNNWFGAVADVSGTYLTKSLDITPQVTAAGLATPGHTYLIHAKAPTYIFMFGPQFTYRKSNNVQPFVRALIGGARADPSVNVTDNGAKLLYPDLSTNDTGLAFGGGGGLDFRLTRKVDLRGAADFIRTGLFNETERNIRVSAAIVYRF